MENVSLHRLPRTFSRSAGGRLPYVALTLALCTCGLGTTARAADLAVSPAAAVATVNGAAIPLATYQRELASATQVEEAREKLAREAMLARLKRDTVESLISRELLIQESRRRNITVDAAVVDREYNRFKANFETAGKYAETLSRMNLSDAQVREQIEQNLTLQALTREAFGTKVDVSAEEARNYYEGHATTFAQPPMVHISHILIRLQQDDNEQRKKAAADRIADIQRQLAAGADFSALAARYSEDGKSKARGGDMGWFVPEQMAPGMSEKLSERKVGEVLPVVKDEFGLHLIKLMESKAAYTPVFEEIKDRISASIRQEKEAKELQTFVKELRQRAKVEIRPAPDHS